MSKFRTTAKPLQMVAGSSLPPQKLSSTRGLVWYRETDLRVHDNAALFTAHNQCAEVSHVFCFNPNEFIVTEFGIEKTGYKRLKFLAEAVYDLSRRINSLGGKLFTFIGSPVDIIPKMFESRELKGLYFQKNIADIEVRQENTITKALNDLDVKVHSFSGDSTLIRAVDLPFEIKDLQFFTSFRKEVERSCTFRPPIPSPSALKPPHDLLQQIDPATSKNLLSDDNLLNTIDLYNRLLQSIGRDIDTSISSTTSTVEDERSVLSFQGGETAALQRVNYYIKNGVNRLSTYKQTRNGMIGGDYSSKLSPWLALGCISVKKIYEEIKKFENNTGIANESTYWLVFELLWRDYMQFYGMKYGNKLFHLGGAQGVTALSKRPWNRDMNLFTAWILGRTGYPFIDANMRELRATGFMSNRGRQVVGSFLVRELSLDWRLGAQYFESTLLDYDVCSNYGNWQYVAGVGSDPREDRHFNIVKQARDYDPNAQYIRLWCPEIANLPTSILLDPRDISPDMRRKYSVDFDKLPEPVVPLLYQTATPVAGKQQRNRKPNHGDVPGRMYSR
eukprot:gene3815-7597_t